ncbi:MAG TPA: DUF5722 domain-containing protein [Methylomirabilota bacterium]|nr:DUF5722 domain-containing protein [Methylomirabilota bacterium]
MQRSYLALAVFLGAPLGAASAPAPERHVSRSVTVARWTSTHHLRNLQTLAEGVRFEIAGEDPFLSGPAPDVADWPAPALRLRLRSDEGGFGQVFWFQTAAAEENSVWFHAPSNAWAEVLLPLPRLPAGTQLRIDPPGAGGVCLLGEVQLEQPGRAGVIGVSATASNLSLTLEGLESGARIVELAPFESYADATRAPVVWQGDRLPATQAVVARFEGERDRLYSGFLAVQSVRPGELRPAGAIRYVEEFRGVSRVTEPFPTAASKKGLQVQMVDDAIALGVKHAALNVDLNSLIDLQGAPDSYTWNLDGRTFRFRRASVDGLPVKPLSDAGMVVSLIILSYASGDPARDAVMLHPRYDPSAPNRLGGFHTVSAEGLRHYRACLEFLADRFSRPDRLFGRVAHYIIGNEVNSHWHWYNVGRAPPEWVTSEYLRAVRVAHTAVRKASSSARVHLSLEHHWNVAFEKDAWRSLSGRRLLEHFAREARLGGDFEWHLAYHPYPENLFQPRTWLDRTATGDFDTPRITFKNIELLPRRLREPDLLFRGRPRRLILSEQGFHSDGTAEGERAQAAGYAYAYFKIDRLDGIDSFILHRHVDHRHEGGLNLGLWRRQPHSVATPDSQKPIYEVFRAADTPAWTNTFAFALPVIGITNWHQVLPR